MGRGTACLPCPGSPWPHLRSHQVSAGSAPRSQRATGPISVRQVSGQALHRPLAQDPHISDTATLAGGRLLPLTTRCVSPQQSSRKESAGNSCRHPQGCPTNPTAGDLGRFMAEPGPCPSDLPGAWSTFLSVLSTSVPWAPAGQRASTTE